MSTIGDLQKCGICNLNKGETLCVRCKRAICDKCWDDEWDLCADCAGYKRAEKWNLSQIIMNSLKTAEEAKEKLKSNCEGCTILRNHLLRILKEMKDVEYFSKTEALPDVEVAARNARELFTDLSISAIVRQKMKAPRDVWRKL